MSQYLLLSTAPRSRRIAPTPSAYWLILQFEITLRIRNETALLLAHPSYTLTGDDEFTPGMLCPPFLAFAISSGELYLDSVSGIEALFTEHETSVDIAYHSRLFLYVLGLTNYTKTFLGTLTEYKESFRERGKFKCYKILRFSVRANTTRDLYNLVDPLVLNRHIYLPLPDEQPYRYLTPCPQSHQGICYQFRGCPLSSNLCRLLESEAELDRFRSTATEVTDQMLYKKFTGFLVQVDVAHFGALASFLINESNVFYLDNHDIEAQYRFSLHRFFRQLIAELALPHFQLLGDGFLACVPGADEAAPSCILGLRTLCDRLAAYTRWVNSKSQTSIGCRCAILYGNYEYGRFDFQNDVPYITGNDVIRVTRLEAGLKGLSDDPQAVIIGVERDSFMKFADPFRQHFAGFGEMADREVASKETVLHSAVWMSR